MPQTAIFWPMIAHVGLVLALYALLGIRRKQAVAAGSARISQFRENTEEPVESLFAKNSLSNQFELPPLFHIVCLALFVTNGAGTTALVLAWIFVLSRCVHAIIHVTSNRIRFRQPAFLVGFIATFALWGALAIHLLWGI